MIGVLNLRTYLSLPPTVPARVVRVCARLQLDLMMATVRRLQLGLECLLVATRVERAAANSLEASNSTYEEISHQFVLVEVKFGSGSSCAIYASHASPIRTGHGPSPQRPVNELSNIDNVDTKKSGSDSPIYWLLGTKNSFLLRAGGTCLTNPFGKS